MKCIPFKVAPTETSQKVKVAFFNSEKKKKKKYISQPETEKADQIYSRHNSLPGTLKILKLILELQLSQLSHNRWHKVYKVECLMSWTKPTRTAEAVLSVPVGINVWLQLTRLLDASTPVISTPNIDQYSYICTAVRVMLAFWDPDLSFALCSCLFFFFTLSQNFIYSAQLLLIVRDSFNQGLGEKMACLSTTPIKDSNPVYCTALGNVMEGIDFALLVHFCILFYW